MQKYTRYRFTAVFVLMILLAAVSIGRVLTKTNGLSSLDFHSYWYAGHFIWDRADPYSSALATAEPRLPVRYWDGVVQTSGSVIQPGLITLPGLTATGILFLAPLARFSWPTASTIWLGVNLGMLFAIAWACARYFGQHLLSRRGIFFLCLLCSLIATREAIETGQSALFTFGLTTLGMVLIRKRQWLSGLLIGIGLSKTTLTFPIIFPLLYLRKLWAICVAGLVQVGGILVLAWIVSAHPWSIMEGQILIGKTLGINTGMHLTQGILQGHPISFGLFVISGLTMLGLLSARLIRVFPIRIQDPPTLLHAWILFATVTMFDLLTIYHRRYDYVAGIAFFAPLVFTLGTSLESLWAPSANERRAVIVLAVIIASIWVLPLYLVLGVKQYTYLFNLASIVAFVTSLWMLLRSVQTTQTLATFHT